MANSCTRWAAGSPRARRSARLPTRRRVDASERDARAPTETRVLAPSVAGRGSDVRLAAQMQRAASAAAECSARGHGAATIVLWGCLDGAADAGGVVVPRFADYASSQAAGAPPVDTAVERGQMPADANTNPSSSGAGEAPPVELLSSEDQSPDDLDLEPESAPEPETDPEDEGPEPIVRPALSCGTPPPALQGGIQGCQTEDQGSVGGQDWFLWYTGGSGCMTTCDNLSGAFRARRPGSEPRLRALPAPWTPCRWITTS